MACQALLEKNSCFGAEASQIHLLKQEKVRGARWLYESTLAVSPRDSPR